MAKVKFSLSNKILSGFLVLVVLFLISVTLNSLVLNRNNQKLKASSENINPSLDAINEFTLLVTRSKMLITNWVYMQSNREDKEALRVLQETEYPSLADRLMDLQESWQDPNEVLTLDSAFAEFDSLLSIEREIMQSLTSFESYEDPMIKLISEDQIEYEVLPRTSSILTMLDRLEQAKSQQVAQTERELIENSDTMLKSFIIIGIILTLLSLAAAIIIVRAVTLPIRYVKSIVDQLGKGDLPKREKRKVRNDETGEMILAVDTLTDGLKSTSAFAADIGRGEYEADFEPLSEKDVLGNALLEMRDNLKKVGEEDRRRNWTSEGLAKFGELLRSQNDNMEKLGDVVLSTLVEYIGANQGGIYLIKEEEGEEPYLYLLSAFAWEKKKYLEQQIYKGEGMTGQVWREAQPLYLTEVPDGYITITSGLGEANPNALFIVPLTVNDEIHGVLELAAFDEFPEYVRDFVLKVAESTASTISSVRVSERTRVLLEDSQELTEQMKAQEEEMRQNMEELQATQEEMARNTKLSQQSVKKAMAVLGHIDRAACLIDNNAKIQVCNPAFGDLLEVPAAQLAGRSLESFTPGMDSNGLLGSIRAGIASQGPLGLQSSSAVAVQTEWKIATEEIDGAVFYVLVAV